MKKIILIYKAIFTLSLSISLFSGCERPIGEIKIDQESKDYCLFAEGSYWVYQDSATLETDSVVINYPISYRFKRSNANGYRCEEYSSGISFYSHDSISSFSVVLTTRNASDKALKPCILVTDYLEIEYHNGEIGESFGYPNSILLERRNNYIINGITFNNIKIFEHKYNEKRNLFYWAKHIGLIRMEVYENNYLTSVRSLIRYNVKPYNQ